MRVIAKANIIVFAKAHPDAEAALSHWHDVAKAAHWSSMAEAAGAMSKAKTVSGNRIRYDIGGGNYRLIVAFNFRRKIAFVKFIGTHAEYDRIDAATVNLF